MKNQPLRGSKNCWLSMMFPPRSYRKPDTACTMPGLVGTVEDQYEVAGGQPALEESSQLGLRQLHQSPSSSRRRTTNSSISARIASSSGGCSYDVSFSW